MNDINEELLIFHRFLVFLHNKAVAMFIMFLYNLPYEMVDLILVICYNKFRLYYI